MKIGYIQSSPIFGDKQKNFTQITNLVKDTKANLLVLPELFATGYTFTSAQEVKRLSENTDGETSHFLQELSHKIQGTVVAGFVEEEKGIVYNSSIIISKGKVVDTYRKIHLFNKEKEYFSPGNKPLKVYNIDGINIGVMICFDWIFPEVSRTMALQGMQVLAHPSNLVMPYCQQAMTTRCIENGIFAVTANRIGNESRGNDNFTFTGASQITSTKGEILNKAPQDTTYISIIEIDENLANNKMINNYNHILQDRKIEFYK